MKLYNKEEEKLINKSIYFQILGSYSLIGSMALFIIFFITLLAVEVEWETARKITLTIWVMVPCIVLVIFGWICIIQATRLNSKADTLWYNRVLGEDTRKV